MREGFRNQHQRAVLETLFKDTLTPAETKQVMSMDIEKASIIEERLPNMIRWMDRHGPVALRALSCTMRHTGCQMRAIPTRL
ncbi:hypothetical protein DW211_06630 [Collinsella sp. AM18-10]|nr:hypothetical protein DW211_06630 [Collinsella sp. AM18-10]